MQLLGWLLGFAHESRLAFGAEKIIGAAGPCAAFNLDLTVPLDQPGIVFQVPSQSGEKWIQEIVAQLRFHVARLLEFIEALLEFGDKTPQFPLK